EPVLTLPGLSRDEVRDALQRATEGEPLRPHELDALTDRADGNPLFLTELWRTWVDKQPDDELPDSVESLVTAQIDRLPFGLRQVLSYAAVLGRSFDRADLAAIADEGVAVDDDLWLALGEFIELEGTRRARFRHALLRDTAYGKLPFKRRRELHLRAAMSL